MSALLPPSSVLLSRRCSRYVLVPPAILRYSPNVGKERSQKPNPQAARTSSYTVRTDDALKVRFSAAVGEEPEVEVGLV